MSLGLQLPYNCYHEFKYTVGILLPDQTMVGSEAPQVLPSANFPSQVFLPVILLYPHLAQFTMSTGSTGVTIAIRNLEE